MNQQPTQSGYVPVEHGELYYETTGEGLAILLLHAGVADHTMWEPQLASFSHSHKVITYDLRGFGVSRSEQASFSNTQDMRDLLTHLGVDKAVIIGNSRGGRIAIDFALAYPQMTSAVVWICGGLGGMDGDATQQEIDWFNNLETIWESKDWATLSDLEAHTWANGIGQSEDRAPAHVRDKVRRMIYSNYTREGAEGEPRPLDPPAIDRLHEITCPLLLIIGDLDTSGTRQSAAILAEKLPNAELVHFPNVAHMVSMEEPDKFNALVLDFLARTKN
jgi:pimeloyl-ACP methyl ester carboxylesterase